MADSVQTPRIRYLSPDGVNVRPAVEDTKVDPEPADISAAFARNDAGVETDVGANESRTLETII